MARERILLYKQSVICWGYSYLKEMAEHLRVSMELIPLWNNDRNGTTIDCQKKPEWACADR